MYNVYMFNYMYYIYTNYIPIILMYVHKIYIVYVYIYGLCI